MTDPLSPTTEAGRRHEDYCRTFMGDDAAREIVAIEQEAARAATPAAPEYDADGDSLSSDDDPRMHYGLGATPAAPEALRLTGAWSYDAENHWLVYTDDGGASAIVAFDVQEQYAARILAAFDRAAAPLRFDDEGTYLDPQTDTGGTFAASQALEKRATPAAPEALRRTRSAANAAYAFLNMRDCPKCGLPWPEGYVHEVCGYE